MDLVRPLGLEGIPCVAAGPRGAPPRWSRYTSASIDLPDLWDEPEASVDRLIDFARKQEIPPVLVYQKDPAVLAISRYRHRLEPWFRFVVPDAQLVEDLVDKQRFHNRAVALGLPVPRTVFGRAGVEEAPIGSASFPAVVKPVVRQQPKSSWRPVARGAKAILVGDAAELRSTWNRPELWGRLLAVQELIPGPETQVVSYHTYIDTDGRVIGEFTGRKIRTRPTAYGLSTAVEITDDSGVRTAGLKALRAFAFTGVAKVDLKLGPDGSLYVLEINARCSLWNHPGALAGVNIPAAMYRRLTDGNVPELPRARPGVTWCQLWGDSLAARSHGVGVADWVRFVRQSEARRAMHKDDPGAAMGVVSYGARLGLRKFVGGTAPSVGGDRTSRTDPAKTRT